MTKYFILLVLLVNCQFFFGQTAVTVKPTSKEEVKLNEVIVKNTLNNPIKIEGNKTSYTVKNNDALNNGTALETIQKIPGVLTDMNGNITMKGKTVTVYIDGLPTNMSGQDLTNYLNSISSSTVSKVEIVNNPGASFDANTAADVINVVTNQKNKRGVNGTLYSATTVYKKHKSENSLALNGLYDKVNWNLNLGYSDVEYLNGMSKVMSDKSNGSTISDNNVSTVSNKPLSIRTGFSFPLKNNSIDVKYSFLNGNENTNGQSEYLSNNNGTITSQTSNGLQEKNSRRNEITTNFMHKFKNPDQSFSLNYQFYNLNRDQNSTNNSDLGSTQYQNGANNKFDSKVNRFKGDLSLPLALFKVSTGFKVTHSDIQSDGIYSNNSGVNSPETRQFDYNDFTVAVYSEINKKYKKWDFTAGIRCEYINFESQTNSLNNGAQQFRNFFPSLNLGYQLNSITNLNLSYSRKVKMPGYQELDPNTIGITNNLMTDGGNPLLKPSFYNNAEFKISLFNYVNFGMSYSQANAENYLVVIKDNNNAYKQTIEPFNNVRNFGTSMGLPIPLGIFTKGLKYVSNIKDLNSIDYLYLYAGTNAIKYDKEGYDNNTQSMYYFGTASQFILPFETKLSLNYNFVSKGNFTIYHIEKTYNKLDLTLSKSLFKKTTKIQFSVSDIFNSGSGFDVLFSTKDYNINAKTLNDSQRVKFSITYNFGSYKSDKKNIKEEIDERENKKSSMEMKM
jgi:iron complex outermembrane receptor protein